MQLAVTSKVKFNKKVEILILIFSRWYHGRLDRIGAEDRLRNFRSDNGTNLGSYLIRESDRKPGSYVLSYLGKTGINHFRFELGFPSVVSLLRITLAKNIFYIAKRVRFISFSVQKIPSTCSII